MNQKFYQRKSFRKSLLPLTTLPSADSRRQGILSRVRWLLALSILCGLAQMAGAVSYTWNVTSGNWSTAGSWTSTGGPGVPLAADSVTFGNTGASSSSNTVNNIVDSSFPGTVANLTYNPVSIAPFIYQVTQIPTGKTLTVTNRLFVGGQNEPGGPFLTYSFLTGGGTLLLTATNLAVENYGTASGANDFATLDLSGLSNFVFNNPNGIISVADTGAGSLTRAAGNLVLAGGSNFITAATINLGTSTAAQAGPTDTLTFGGGTNIINVGTFNIANNKNPANVNFATPTGGLRIRGVSGTDSSRATIIIGNRNQTGTGTTTGSFVATGNPLDIKAGTLTIGANPNTGTPGAGGDFGVGNMLFDTGTVDATNVIVASTATVTLGRATGTLTVGPNGTLVAGAGGITLLNQSVAEDAAHVGLAILNISNGTVVCNGNLGAAANVGTGAGGPGSNAINFINGGKLSMGAGCFVGSTAFPISSFNLIENSTLQFSAPSTTQANIIVNNLVWPANDSLLTIRIGSLPATATVGSTIPIIQFTSMSGGTFTAPALVLPAGVTGAVSLSGNTVLVTITSSVYPSLTTLSPSLTTFATNTALTTTAASTVSTITNVQVIATSTTLGGLTTTTVTNSIGSPSLTVTGLGTATASISYALATNTIYLAVTVSATDANGVTVSLTSAKFDTLVPVLVIEASDFNYSSGGFQETPANGGLALFVNQTGTEGIDEHKAARAGALSYYRPSDAVVIQAANPGFGTPPSLTEQKFVTALANGDTTDVELMVGFNTPGDWLNYTRTYGAGGSAPAGLYNVWCYLATSGTGVQAALSQVTSDPTQGTQTTNFLGNFGTAAFSDNGFNNFVYVPLVDQFGNRTAIGLTNAQTLKSTVVGNPNIAFYLLVPVAPVFTPVLLQVYPNGTAQYQATNHITFTIGPAQGSAINTNGVHLILNGSDVTSGLTFSQVGGVWTVTYPIAPNFTYTATLNATNNAGLSTSFSTSFDTFNPTNYQWEAVDYDYSTNADGGTTWVSGLFIDNPVPTGNSATPPNNGTLATNSYWGFPAGFSPGVDPFFIGSAAQQNVDVNYTNAAGIQHNYRSDIVGSEITADILRPKFLAAQTNFNDTTICMYDLGWFNLGDWVNYTRTYPANKYNVWGRLAGGAGAFSGTTLSLVTSGVGTSNQTTQVLGSFADPGAAGWQTWHWIPLLDTNGNQAVVQLGGQATLRLTSGNNLNSEFFMLTPATTPAPFNVTLSPSAGQIQMSFPTQISHNYTVWVTSSLSPANWTQVGSKIVGDGLVHVVPQSLTGNQGFYRVVSQ
ncbi:MAG TPA: hypothetical protein VK815_12890 [Candidatus Acidoferrales bacterium]|jgi:hypothetical protein|nr:hypothetical protein [Candidatus Acidoferrales bacterium]